MRMVRDYRPGGYISELDEYLLSEHANEVPSVKVKEALDTIPESMWQQIDSAMSDLKLTRPPNTFTRAEFMAKQNICKTQATRLLLKLLDKGVITRHGNGNIVYYQLVQK